MENENEISAEAKRDLLTNVMIPPARNTLYVFRIQKRAAEIAGDHRRESGVVCRNIE
jgi:hypothetical protein